MTLVDDEIAIQKIASCGFKNIEIFDGNLMRFASEPERFKALLEKYQVNLLGVYVGGQFIYPDALPDELFRIEQVAILAAGLGAKHLVVGGGSISSSGIRERISAPRQSTQPSPVYRTSSRPDCQLPSHLGSMVQHPEEIDKIFALTPISFCRTLRISLPVAEMLWNSSKSTIRASSMSISRICPMTDSSRSAKARLTSQPSSII